MEPGTTDPKAETRNPGPGTLDLKQKTRNPNRDTARNSTRNRKPFQKRVARRSDVIPTSPKLTPETYTRNLHLKTTPKTGHTIQNYPNRPPKTLISKAKSFSCKDKFTRKEKTRSHPETNSFPNLSITNHETPGWCTAKRKCIFRT